MNDGWIPFSCFRVLVLFMLADCDTIIVYWDAALLMLLKHLCFPPMKSQSVCRERGTFTLLLTATGIAPPIKLTCMLLDCGKNWSTQRELIQAKSTQKVYQRKTQKEKNGRSGGTVWLTGDCWEVQWKDVTTKMLQQRKKLVAKLILTKIHPRKNF